MPAGRPNGGRPIVGQTDGDYTMLSATIENGELVVRSYAGDAGTFEYGENQVGGQNGAVSAVDDGRAGERRVGECDRDGSQGCQDVVK